MGCGTSCGGLFSFQCARTTKKKNIFFCVGSTDGWVDEWGGHRRSGSACLLVVLGWYCLLPAFLVFVAVLLYACLVCLVALLFSALFCDSSASSSSSSSACLPLWHCFCLFASCGTAFFACLLVRHSTAYMKTFGAWRQSTISQESTLNILTHNHTQLQH